MKPSVESVVRILKMLQTDYAKYDAVNINWTITYTMEESS